MRSVEQICAVANMVGELERDCRGRAEVLDSGNLQSRRWVSQSKTQNESNLNSTKAKTGMTSVRFSKITLQNHADSNYR
jgi:hypothetical protein